MKVPFKNSWSAVTGNTAESMQFACYGWEQRKDAADDPYTLRHFQEPV